MKEIVIKMGPVSQVSLSATSFTNEQILFDALNQMSVKHNCPIWGGGMFSNLFLLQYHFPYQHLEKVFFFALILIFKIIGIKSMISKVSS